MAVTIEKTTLVFLNDLAKNNNREWFSENKSRYLLAQCNVIQFLDQLIIKMNQSNPKSQSKFLEWKW